MPLAAWTWNGWRHRSTPTTWTTAMTPTMLQNQSAAIGLTCRTTVFLEPVGATDQEVAATDVPLQRSGPGSTIATTGSSHGTRRPWARRKKSPWCLHLLREMRKSAGFVKSPEGLPSRPTQIDGMTWTNLTMKATRPSLATGYRPPCGHSRAAGFRRLAAATRPTPIPGTSPARPPVSARKAERRPDLALPCGRGQ